MIPAHILFPVDFSERSAGTAPYVQAMAKQFGSAVTLLHAVELDRYAASIEPFVNYELASSIRREELQKVLDAFANKHFQAIETSRILEVGDAAKAITRFENEHVIDLIMMPSHGYGPFRSLLLGSVTAKVLHDAKCPVWTSAHVEYTPDEIHIPCRNVICAVDLTPRTEALMRWSADMAKSLGATLRFVHATPGEERWVPVEEFRAASRKEIDGFQAEAGTAMPVCVGLGLPGDVLREEAKRHGADLIVIGRGCIKEGLGRLRTHAYSIIRQAPCPVISV